MPLKIGARVEGERNILLKIRAEERERNEKFIRGMEKACIFLLGKSLLLVPIDTGELYESGEVTATGQGHNRQFQVGYEAEHAAAVHERLDLHHTHGQAKYLEQPYRQYRKYMMEIVRRETGHRTSG